MAGRDIRSGGDVTLWFSRARLRKDAPAAALRGVLLPNDDSARAAVSHRLVWALFSDGPDRRRDFLWREEADGVFYFLSERPPVDPHFLFELEPPKEFAPVLKVGDRLRFRLRANATKAKATGPSQRGKPVDVVMDALHSLDRAGRAAKRSQIVRERGIEWLAAQASRSGFALDSQDVQVLSHRVLTMPRDGGKARLGVLDFEGTLSVREPDRFVEALQHGFGRAKAFGNGLMLIRHV